MQNYVEIQESYYLGTYLVLRFLASCWAELRQRHRELDGCFTSHG